jgi:hypothetical protein
LRTSDELFVVWQMESMEQEHSAQSLRRTRVDLQPTAIRHIKTVAGGLDPAQSPPIAERKQPRAFADQTRQELVSSDSVEIVLKAGDELGEVAPAVSAEQPVATGA